VKIRGFRIELGEIEAALAQHPSVKDAVVIAREDSPGEKRLVAYIVSKGQEAPTVADWRGFLREKVPDYMVPAAFVILDQFPLSSNGKVERKALPAPDQTRPEMGAEFVAPRTPIEEALASIWCAVLNVKRVGIHDNFFDLGGDSILATQALTRITQSYATEINLFELFENPTIAGLAETVTRKQVENIDPGDLARILGELEELPEGR
jgi:aryl carrier-like protein